LLFICNSKHTTDTIVQLLKGCPSVLITLCCRFDQNLHIENVFFGKVF
jgi:hypothetical protein